MRLKVIVIKVGDGMGNQLFNYACGYAAARREHDTLMLDTSDCDNSTLRKFELDKFQLKYDGRESFPNHNLWQKVYKKIRRNLKYRVIMEREIYHNKSGRYTVNDIDPRVYQKKRLRNKYLCGYWQHLAYFEMYLDEITEMMTPAYEQSREVTTLIQELKSTPTCALHVRGGDITGPGKNYFKHAIARMEKEKPDLRYVIFTNDREKAKEALEKIMGEHADRMSYVSELGTFSDVDEFFLMAACQNQILSNSTYSTWAAYLNKNPHKTVIMPDDSLSERMRQKNWIVLA